MPEIIQFIDARGTTTTLTGDGTGATYAHVASSMGLLGMDMPPIQFVEDEIFGQPGSVLRTVKTKTRDVDIPLIVRGATEAALAAAVRTLSQALNPNGDGNLVVTSADGTQRYLLCRYRGGFEGDQALRFAYRNHRIVVLSFHANDPYWRDPAATSVQYSVNNTGAFLGTPFLPLHISGSSISGTVTINNMGDVNAYPIWTINGPASTIVLTNNTTGQVINLGAYVLAAGHYITIDTNPLVKTVLLDGVTNLYSYLTGTPQLWPLQTGNNSVTYSVTGITNASYLGLSYLQRYFTK